MENMTPLGPVYVVRTSRLWNVALVFTLLALAGCCILAGHVGDKWRCERLRAAQSPHAATYCR